MFRLILIPLALVILLVLAAALMIPLLLDKDAMLQLAAGALQEQTGATLTIDGDARLSVLPTPGIVLSDAAITVPDAQLSSLKIGKLQVGLQLLPLLGGQIGIDSLTLDGVRASMQSGSEQNRADTSTLSDADLDALYAIRRNRMATSGDASSAVAVVIPPLALQVKQLTISDARLELLYPDGSAPKLLELVRLRASDLNLNGATMPVDMVLRLLGKQVVEVSLKGNIRIDQQHQTVTLEQVDATATGALANTLQLHSSGVVDLSGQTADLQLALELGETRGNGTLRYSAFKSPQVDSVLQINLLDPVLLALAGPDAVSASGQQKEAESEDKPLPLNALRAIDARAVLDIDQARFGAHTVNKMHARLVALDGLIQVEKLSGELHDGSLDANGTLNARHSAVTFDTSGSISRLDIAKAQAATKAKSTVTGSATMTWLLHGEGASQKALKDTLQGPVKLTTEEVTLKSVSVEKLLCQAVALSNQEQLTAPFAPDTRFKTLAADIQLAAGRATFNPLQADLPQITLGGSGHYDLQQKTFEASLRARLSPELEQLDHACRVSKRLLAVDLPVNCAGSITAEPSTWCSVDAVKILQDMTAKEGLEKLEKKASKFLDKLFNKKD